VRIRANRPPVRRELFSRPNSSVRSRVRAQDRRTGPERAQPDNCGNLSRVEESVTKVALQVQIGAIRPAVPNESITFQFLKALCSIGTTTRALFAFGDSDNYCCALWPYPDPDETVFVRV
jgi:hypothetical protein